MAVEPREFKKPSERNTVAEVASSTEPEQKKAEVETGDDSKGSLPLVPILAGVFGLAVIGLLFKVITAK